MVKGMVMMELSRDRRTRLELKVKLRPKLHKCLYGRLRNNIMITGMHMMCYAVMLESSAMSLHSIA